MKIYLVILALPLCYTFSVSASMIDSDNLHALIKQCAPKIKAESKVAYGIVKTESAGNPVAIGINTALLNKSELADRMAPSATPVIRS